ncbi:glycoside hydrolase family 27 protein [Pelagicoccus sp. SDUM812003]|uniref:glycoside hydrolase family 27 protein n=1 Tax=Pelagicoccus sp. SDUM812003 TaxID=3041267 RepID=UPI00280EA741|nr:glycoside hydrolase family 27 protein [Pelagicoccus sp. SDUM812003]MDQ8205249.1 glycoside hydrolase family 27 protein [Pelagicoccus sp. SDUM812003]
MKSLPHARIARFATKAMAGLAAFTLAISASAQKFENLALTPPMGWNSWNTFESAIDEDLIKETAQAMIDSGMRDAGYVYIVIDDCWSLRERDAEGNLVADPEKFPSGMKALADYLHERGFKLGMYADAGKTTCAGYPGSQGHEYQDARTFAAWGVDYLKYDWCATGTRDPIEAYTTMRDALYAAGRPIVFSICEWGDNDPWLWAQDIGHLWRISGDIYDCWDCEQEWSRGFKVILDRYHELKPSVVGRDGLGVYSGPDGWNDLDMLEVGNPGLSVAESRSHFTLWALIGSPLMAGNDVRSMSPEITEILTHPDVIAINQDPDGVAAWRFGIVPGKHQTWIKPLSDGDWAVCVLNTSDQEQRIEIEWHRMERALSGEFEIHDVWNDVELGDTDTPLTAKIGSHDVLLMRLSPKR